jgi:hypothetical protein
MTVNLLTVYILITLYFYVGSFHEERRLLAEFSDAYRDYQQQVPRLIPRPGRCYSPPRLNGRSIFPVLCWHQGAVCGAEAFTPPNLLRRPK